jgi:hypothetical protein
MNIAALKEKLIRVARRATPSDHVPYTFEKRVMARIAALPKVDVYSFWANNLWRAAAPCAAIMVFFAAWTFFLAAPQPEVQSADLEKTVLAPFDTLGDVW